MKKQVIIHFFVTIMVFMVINLTGNKFGNILRKLLAIPGKPIYYLYKLTKIHSLSVPHSLPVAQKE